MQNQNRSLAKEDISLHQSRRRSESLERNALILEKQSKLNKRLKIRKEMLFLRLDTLIEMINEENSVLQSGSEHILEA